MNAEQLQLEVARALGDKNIKEHQRRWVAAIVLLAKCTTDEALAGAVSVARKDAVYARGWGSADMLDDCVGWLLCSATGEVLSKRPVTRLPVTSLADYRTAKERRRDG